MSGHARNILVTGAAVGFGRATVELFATEDNVRIFAIDRDEAALAAAGFPAACVIPVVLDLANRDQTAAAMAEIEAEHGHAHTLVNNAGGTLGRQATAIEDLDFDDWDALLAVNLGGAALMARTVVRGMKAAGVGRIVNVSSGAGFRASRTGLQAYTAAKHGLHGLTRQLAQELGPYGITVNVVAPGLQPVSPNVVRQWNGYSEEKQAAILAGIPMRTLGSARDIAEAVHFLASDRAGYITGQILPVNGGAF